MCRKLLYHLIKSSGLSISWLAWSSPHFIHFSARLSARDRAKVSRLVLPPSPTSSPEVQRLDRTLRLFLSECRPIASMMTSLVGSCSKASSRRDTEKGCTQKQHLIVDDDDKSSLYSDNYRNVDSKSCIRKSRPTNNELAIVTICKLARSSR